MRLFCLLLLVAACNSEKGELQYSLDGVIKREPGAVVTFQQIQREILAPQCASCHSWALDEAKVNSRLVAGKPEESRLFRLVENGRMPMGGSPLSTAQLELLREYINALARPPASETETETAEEAELI